jgi:hypothetical protein
MGFVVGAAIIGGVASLGGAAIGAIGAGRRAKKARREANRLGNELKTLEKNRQEIINPYEGVKDLSGMITDLSGKITDTSHLASNAFKDLGVATKSAEIQMEQSDIALANTLDALQSSGASAGGATALAQAALKSKQGVAANIEQQEAQNEKLRAQGEQELSRVKMAEAQRIQQAQFGEAQRVQAGLMGEAGRLQQAEVSGAKYMYEEQERRETEQMNRIQAQMTGQQQAQAQARSDQAGAIASGVTGAVNVAGSYMSYKGQTTKPS